MKEKLELSEDEHFSLAHFFILLLLKITTKNIDKKVIPNNYKFYKFFHIEKVNILIMYILLDNFVVFFLDF